MTAVIEPPPHGTRKRYASRTHPCRCAPCIAAAAEYRTLRRAAAATKQAREQRAEQTQPARRVVRVDALVAAFRTSVPAPDLTGALCAGRPEVFDPRGTGEGQSEADKRHLHAIELCGRCPVRAACGSWVRALPTHEQPLGVVAGRLIEGGTQ